MEAIEPSVISDLARQEGTTILRVIDEIERSSERNDQIILIKKLLKYMVENNDEKLLPLMLPYLHHIDKDVLGTESLADELSIGGHKITSRADSPQKKLAQKRFNKAYGYEYKESALTQSTESFTQLFTERNQLFPERILIAAIRDQSIFKEIFKVCNDETCELLLSKLQRYPENVLT